MPTLQTQKGTKRTRIMKMKSVPVKKKKVSQLKQQPPKDTISETISFVIKGKVTPIKQNLLSKKKEIILNQKKNNKQQPKDKKSTEKTNKNKKPSPKICKKTDKCSSVVETKVQIKTAKKPINPPSKSLKKSSEKSAGDIAAAKRNKNTKVKKKISVPTMKSVKKSVKECKTVGKDEKKQSNKTINVKKTSPKQNISENAEDIKCKLDIQQNNKVSDNKIIEHDKETQQTIQKLLLQAQKAIKPKSTIKKSKKKETDIKDNKKKKLKKPNLSQKVTNKAGKSTRNKASDSPLKTQIKSEVKDRDSSSESSSDNMSLNDLRNAVDDKTEIKEKISKNPIDTKKTKKELLADKKTKKALLKRHTPKGKMIIMKKRLPLPQDKSRIKEDLKTRKSKLFGFWNGPKRHRVASLNALAKVHCLYENESRSNILDSIETTTIKKEQTIIRKDDVEKRNDGVTTRTLRSVPGLRAVGKHWDMHDTTSSSDDNNSGTESSSEASKSKERKKELSKKSSNTDSDDSKKPVKKRRRNRTELIMDLKDMVVRKRMASLNASAILAASYSLEKRAERGGKSDDSYESDSSDDYFLTTDDDTVEDKKKKCFEEDVKKEEQDRKVIEVHTTPNKKVAVILNQDTDVTITGVYVNSTTRSTHQDGYCSIAGMQYRISATSHTQTAATAVATETLLQSSSCSAPESINSDSASSKSYTPLDALSNMQPPPGPGLQHGHPVLHHASQQHHMGPPALPLPPHQLSPGRRHGCSSAFTSPHANPPYPHQSVAAAAAAAAAAASHHHLPLTQGELGYIHGYYQPAGPLITVPHGHGLAPPPTKSAPLSETSSTSTPPPASHQPPPPPTAAPPASSNGDTSDNEVIITSVTTNNKEAISQNQQQPPSSYRCTQYPSGPAAYSYNLAPYHYNTPPPPTATYGHHELCYPPASYMHHKYTPTTYRRYITGAPYYSANPQEIYPLQPTGPSQQLVTTTPVQASGTTFQAVPNGPPPPPTLIESYPPPPPPTLVESYQPPPPHCYPTYGPPPSCYTHSSTRAIPYMNTAYPGCPCPMQSCPKNVHTGPLTGESKRSTVSTIVKDTMPLPPVALALPLEPASATGPPSPARGSAGMPPPPSPAGAVYQPPPPLPKQESQSPDATDESKTEVKRKARIGKDMVRRNTMLLMCNPTVKREIESPKEKELIDQKKEITSESEEMEKEELICEAQKLKEEKVQEEQEEKENKIVEELGKKEILEPCVLTTVAENVKVKNMKRKLSMSQEKQTEPEPVLSPSKKQKLGSYKDFIKKNTNAVKLNSGKQKLLQDQSKCVKTARCKQRRANNKRKACGKEEPSTQTKQIKLSKPLTVCNANVAKQNCKQSKEKQQKTASVALKTSVTVLDNLISNNNIEKTIESVVSESVERTSSPDLLTSPPESPATLSCSSTTTNTSSSSTSSTNKETSALKTVNNKCVNKETKETTTNKKSTNLKKCISQVKTCQSECKKVCTVRKKSRGKEVVPQVVAKVPRRSLQLPRWSNGWRWQGEAYEAKVFLNSDETMVVRKCYPAMRHSEGDVIESRDCVLLKAGLKKNELPFVAKIAALWENPDDGEMMMSLLWYYRPEHTEQGRLPTDQPDEVFASRHKDSNSVACIDDKCYVLTFNEYCRYRKNFRRLEEGIEETQTLVPIPESYPRLNRQPPSPLTVSPEMVFFCRRVYDFRQKRIIKNPS